LAQLANKAGGELLVIVDADIIVTNSYLKEMVYPIMKGADVVSGYTEVMNQNGLSRMQALDWKGSIFLLKIMADLGFPITALGNNMLIKKSAYVKIGGFEAIGKTKVEDLKISKAFYKAGFKIVQIMEEQGHAFTQPMKSLRKLAIQRRRWVSGVLNHQSVLGTVLSLERLSLPILLFLMIFSDPKYIGQLIVLFAFLFLTEKAKTIMVDLILRSKPKRLLFVEPIFIALLNTFALLSLIVSPKVVWKNRK
jgi:cellulose synthase/poly-beta-1,6-N-acetylglucosamine synthase-like glycosyltransferase